MIFVVPFFCMDTLPYVDQDWTTIQMWICKNMFVAMVLSIAPRSSRNFCSVPRKYEHEKQGALLSTAFFFSSPDRFCWRTTISTKIYINCYRDTYMYPYTFKKICKNAIVQSGYNARYIWSSVVYFPVNRVLSFFKQQCYPSFQFKKWAL